MTVHNHGPAEGRGLDCGERRLPDGSLRGNCMLPAEEVSAAHEDRDVASASPAPEGVVSPELDALAEDVLFKYLADIPSVRARASDYARQIGRVTDLDILVHAAVDSMAFNRTSLLALVAASLQKVLVPASRTAEEAWAEHSIGMAWDSEEHRYGEYRQFISGFEYRDGL